MQLGLDIDGWCHGPLFSPPRKRRPPVRIKGKEGQRHRAQTRRATPKWVEVEVVRALYAEAKRLTRATGELHVVDHIVPKMSPWVCGLHCAANLQILPWLENAKKANNWWPDMWAAQGELF